MYQLVTREGIDIVVEVIGGIEPARSLILAAMERGAAVVTRPRPPALRRRAASPTR